MSVNRSLSQDKNRLDARLEREKREYVRENQGAPGQGYDNRWLSREDLQDIAKLGGDILKRTVASGIEVIKEVKDGLPKEATQFIAKGKEEVIRGLTKDVAQALLTGAVDRFFSKVREHRLEVSIRLRRDPELEKEEEERQETKRRARHQKKSSSEGSGSA